MCMCSSTISTFCGGGYWAFLGRVMPLGARNAGCFDWQVFCPRRVSLVGAVDFPLVARLGTELLPSDLTSLSCSLFCKQCAFFMFPTLPDSQMTPFKSKTNSRPPTLMHIRCRGIQRVICKWEQKARDGNECWWNVGGLSVAHNACCINWMVYAESSLSRSDMGGSRAQLIYLFVLREVPLGIIIVIRVYSKTRS